MSKCELNIQIDESFQGSIDEGWLKRVVEETLDIEGIDSLVELGLVITSDQIVRELNQTYRDVDEATDVLAFALFQREGSERFIMPPDDVLHLGEVVISYPRVMKQAKEQHHPPQRELALLVIHGMLHLLSYDDELPEGEQRMRAAEAKVLGRVDEWDR